MQTKSDKSVIKTAHGKELEKPIPYEFTWQIFDTIEEVSAAGKLLTNAEQVKVRNVEALSAARSAAYQAALDAAGIVKPTAENDVQVALMGTYKMLVAAKTKDGSRKYTDEQAKNEAEEIQGASFAKSPF